MRNVAYVYHRGGVEPVGRLDGVTVIQWDRRRDDVSEVRIELEGMSSECCAMLANIHAVKYEIVVFRDDQREWEGPITLIQWRTDGATINARDVCFFAQRTVCKEKWSSAASKERPKGDTSTHRVQRIMEKEMLPWERAGANFLANLDIRDNDEVARTTKTTYAFAQYVWNEMDDMAIRSGIDYTVYRRSLIVFDVHQPIGKGRRLTNDDFVGDLEISQYGVELAVAYYVTDNYGAEGHARIEDVYDYGPVELLSAAYGSGAEDANTQPVAPLKPKRPLRSDYKTQSGYDSAMTQYRKDRTTYLKALEKYKVAMEKYVAELRDQAERNIRGRYPIPTQVRVPQNSRLTPDAVESLWDWLVPGTLFPIYSDNTCLTLEQEQKLDRVTVLENEDGESVTVILSNQSLGSDISDDGTAQTLGGARVFESAEAFHIEMGASYGYDKDDPMEVAIFADFTVREGEWTEADG